MKTTGYQKKKTTVFLMAVLAVLSMITAGAEAKAATVGLLEAPPQETTAEAAAPQEITAVPETGETNEAASEEEIVDITTLSSSMMFTQLNTILSSPEEYLGKTIITAGQLDVLELGNRQILSCYLVSPSGCCRTSLEFVTTEDFKYPDNYPSPGSVIFVKGTLATYEEEGVCYCRLENAVVSTSKID